jgi:glycosyltransferase involved in cell wall biosynthesis
MEEARSFARDHHLPVEFAGWQPAAVLQTALSRACALVLPSQQESFGVVMAEALCCGAPVIGWAPTVHELGEALNLPVGLPLEDTSLDPAALADQILSVTQDTKYSGDWRRTVSSAAREFFRLDRYTQRNLELYEQILSAGKPASS